MPVEHPQLAKSSRIWWRWKLTPVSPDHSRRMCRGCSWLVISVPERVYW